MAKRLNGVAGFICAIGLAWVFLFQSDARSETAKTRSANSDAIDRSKAEAFLKALLKRDEAALTLYGLGYFASGKLDPGIAEFLYKDTRQKKSVTEIADEGRLEFAIVHQKNKPVVTVLFFPEKYKALTGTKPFLRDQWMKKYFACEFSTERAQWQLHYNFCFADTDGPYTYDEE